MKPDYDRAAEAATRTLLMRKISSAPVFPLPVLKNIPGVLVVSFAEASQHIGIDRSQLVTMFGSEHQDAVTVHYPDNPGLQYIVTYNQQLPLYMLQRALARQLGHIILGHDGSRPDDVREAEASAFAYHFLCPRPLIRAVQDAGIRVTAEVVGNLTGCYEGCLSGMRSMPGATVPAELNRALRAQFSDYLDNFVNYQKIIASEDHSSLADFGTYFDNYED